MLVLTRKVGEEIIIDGHIRVTITALKGDRVRIGITAPPHIQVDRAEIHAKRQDWVEQEAGDSRATEVQFGEALFRANRRHVIPMMMSC